MEEKSQNLNVKIKFTLFLIVAILCLSLVIINYDGVLIRTPNRVIYQTGDDFTSFCSLEADRRGPHQNVITISLYGSS